MRRLTKLAFIAVAFSFFAFSADSAMAQNRRYNKDRKEYRKEVREARREYRKDVREARRDYRRDRRNNGYSYGRRPRGRAYGYYRNRPNRVYHRRSVRSGAYYGPGRYYRRY